jgi:hypothetical protein
MSLGPDHLDGAEVALAARQVGVRYKVRMGRTS